MRPDQDFAMDWESDARGEKQVGAIAKALKGAHTLYLATDPDREGEAISWHVKSMLDDRKALKGVKVQRISFNEITRSAIRAAIAAPRDLDLPLIEAYLARRALDYLVGFTLSPVLWRKLPGSRSAGRVQSVALRLICEREAEIEVFRAREYWTVEAVFTTPGGAPFTARLTHLDGKRLDQFDLANEALAQAAKAAVEAGTFTVGSVEKRRVKRNPPAPFTTSTLQQEASRKLGFGAQQTMRTAQQLYEGIDIEGETVGLISYMRTDGVQMAREAVFAIRDHVKSAVWPGLPAGSAARIPDQGEERPGGARGDPPDRRGPDAGLRCARPDGGPAAAIRIDLEARGRVADAVGRTGSGRRGGHRRQGPEAARHRLDRRVRRLPEAVSRGHRRRRRWRPPRTKTIACCRRWRSATRCAVATWRRCSTSPSLRRATPRPAWSRSWKSWGLAGRPPTRRSCRCCRTANTCGSTSAASFRRTAAGWSPRS